MSTMSTGIHFLTRSKLVVVKTLSFMRSCQMHTSTRRLKKIPTNLKGKSKSSQEWLTRHINDPYVHKAHEHNYRARSAFKLIEIDDKAKILKPGQVVIECGAAPGAWTQVIVDRINSTGKDPKKRAGTVVGIDLLPIEPLDGAIFLSESDFTDLATKLKIKEILNDREKLNAGDKEDSPRKTEDNDVAEREFGMMQPDENAEAMKCVNVVLSDMAPNATGNRGTDHERIVSLVEKALEFAVDNGKEGGHFLAKLWDGNGTKRLESKILLHYEKVMRIKPPSSRNDSSELFLLGKFKK